MTEIRPSRKKTILYSLMPLLALIMLLEAGGRLLEIFRPPLPVDIGMGFSNKSRLFLLSPVDPRFRATNPDKLTQFVAQRFEVTKPADVFRIFVLGESSIYHLNEDLVAMANKLESGTRNTGKKIQLINAGGLSYASQRILIIARELLEYEPDLAIIYVGNNEFEEVQQLQFYAPETAASQEFLAHFAFYRMFRDLIARDWITKLKREHDERLLSEAATSHWVGVPTFSQSDADNRMAAFRINLTEIVRTFQSRHIPLLIGTVPSNHVNPYIFRKFKPLFEPIRDLLEQGAYEEAKRQARDFLNHFTDRHQSSDVENGIIREVASKNQVPLVDMEKVISDAEPHGIPGETLFVDHCHLNPDGRLLWTGAFGQAIATMPSFKAWQHTRATTQAPAKR